MKKVEYRFEINKEILKNVLDIAEDGTVSYAFMYDLKKLYEEAELTPNKDMSWYLSRLISLYYSTELIAYDETFKEINTYLIREWQKRLPKELQEDYKKKIFKNTYTVSF